MIMNAKNWILHEFQGHHKERERQGWVIMELSLFMFLFIFSSFILATLANNWYPLLLFDVLLILDGGLCLLGIVIIIISFLVP